MKMNLKKHSKSFLIAALALALLGVGAEKGISFFKEKKPKQAEFIASSPLTKAIASEKWDVVDQILLKEVPSKEDLDNSYITAIQHYNYSLAIRLYHLGATPTPLEEKDILWIAIHTVDFPLIDQLVSQGGQVRRCHLDRIRAHMTTDILNWAYLYGEDGNVDGYQDYLKNIKTSAKKLVQLYQEQHPIPQLKQSAPNFSQEKYEMLFGKDKSYLQSFAYELKETVEDGHSFTKAVHGTHRTQVLLNEHGQEIGVLKTQNEILAYLLDHDHFAGVPPAAYVDIPGKGRVVVQKWLVGTDIATGFQGVIDGEELQKMKVLDMRIGNSDRNKGNYLVVPIKDKNTVIPIDHDLIMYYLPNDFLWETPYLSQEFTPTCQKYIRALDIEKDARIMENLNYSPEQIKSMKIRTVLIKMAVDKKLHVKELDMVFRFFYNSFLEDKSLTASSSEEEIKIVLSEQFDNYYNIVHDPVETWEYIGHNGEFYF